MHVKERLVLHKEHELFTPAVIDPVTSLMVVRYINHYTIMAVVKYMIVYIVTNIEILSFACAPNKLYQTV